MPSSKERKKQDLRFKASDELMDSDTHLQRWNINSAIVSAEKALQFLLRIKDIG